MDSYIKAFIKGGILLPINDPDDESLGETYTSSLPAAMTSDEVIVASFIRSLSSTLIEEALIRGERDISILDVYMTPDKELLKSRHPQCHLRHFNNIDLLSPKNDNILDRIINGADNAFDTLLSRQRVGMFMQNMHNVIDLYYAINPNQNARSSEFWKSHRKSYISLVVPAVFWLFGSDYATARNISRTVSLDTLISMQSENGISVSETESDTGEEVVLPLKHRMNIKTYLNSMPDIIYKNDTFEASDKANECHISIQSGIKKICNLQIA